MHCFFRFECAGENLIFHAEYCLERAVHFLDGTVALRELLTASETKEEKELLLFLNRFAANNEFFTFLQEKNIQFIKTKEGYEDTSSDV